MIRYLKNRLRAYIESVLDNKTDDLAEMAVSKINLFWIAKKAAEDIDIDALVERIGEQSKDGGLVDYDNLAGSIDVADLALQFDTADIAGEVDHYRLASHICMSTLAENFDVEEIASHVELDYKCLAAAILKELRPVEVRPSA